MRTKTKILAALMGLAGAVTASAQVYSLNTVGYINITAPPGYTLIANQLDSGTNTIYNLLSNAVPGSMFYKFNNVGGYTIFGFDDADFVWYPADNTNATLNPGEGGFFYNPWTTNQTFTFVGSVLQGTNTVSLPKGYSIVSLVVPQAGSVTNFSFPADPGDMIYRYSTPGGYTIYTFDDVDLVWYPEPSLNVGESFFINKIVAENWTRVFNVR